MMVNFSDKKGVCQVTLDLKSGAGDKENSSWNVMVCVTQATYDYL